MLEKKLIKKTQTQQTNPNRMKQGKEVFTVKLLKPLKINRENSEKLIPQEYIAIRQEKNVSKNVTGSGYTNKK